MGQAKWSHSLWPDTVIPLFVSAAFYTTQWLSTPVPAVIIAQFLGFVVVCVCVIWIRCAAPSLQGFSLMWAASLTAQAPGV